MTGSRPFTWRTMTFRSVDAGEWSSDVLESGVVMVGRKSRNRGPRQYEAWSYAVERACTPGYGATPQAALDDMVENNAALHLEAAKRWEHLGR